MHNIGLQHEEDRLTDLLTLYVQMARKYGYDQQ
jgi:hypothetical protein